MSNEINNDLPILSSVFMHWSEGSLIENQEMSPAEFIALANEIKQAHINDYGAGAWTYYKTKVDLKYDDGRTYAGHRFDLNGSTDVVAELRERAASGARRLGPTPAPKTADEILLDELMEAMDVDDLAPAARSVALDLLKARRTL